MTQFQCGFCAHEFKVKDPGVNFSMLVYCPKCCTATGKIIENVEGTVEVHELNGACKSTAVTTLGPNNLDHPKPGVTTTIAEICPADAVDPAFTWLPRPCVVCTSTPRQNTLVFSIAHAFEHIDPDDYHARMACKHHFVHCLAPRGLWLIRHPDIE